MAEVIAIVRDALLADGRAEAVGVADNVVGVKVGGTDFLIAIEQA